MWNNGENDVIVNNETFDFPNMETNPDEYLFERHVPMDVNGDGLMDIVGVSNSAGAVVAYINPGAHNQPWVRRVLSTKCPGAVNLTVADVNGDGKPDVIVAMRYQPDTVRPGRRWGSHGWKIPVPVTRRVSGSITPSIRRRAISETRARFRQVTSTRMARWMSWCLTR